LDPRSCTFAAVSSKTPSGKINFRTKSELVYESLRGEILSGDIAPGQTIDQESVAARLDVSRMPLRQALLRLQTEGLLQLRPHHSAVVTPLSEADVVEVYAMRGALEAMLAAEGAKRRTDADLERMSAELDRQTAAVAGHAVPSFVKHDRAFHRALYEASGFVSACLLVEQLRDRSDRYVQAWASSGYGAKFSVAEHVELLAAVRASDSEQARVLTQAHIDRGAQFLVSRIRDGASTTSTDA
jgi:DNA-binding GntR family transcriptional regulator